MLKIICRAIGHRRDRKSIRPLMDGWRGECRRCGAPLVRSGQRGWRPAAPRSHAPQA